MNIDFIYPIGSIYMSVNSTNPGTLFGGTWEAISKGRCLMGAGVVEANNDNWCGTTNAGDWTAYAGNMGGETYHQLTVSEMPSHTHGMKYCQNGRDIVTTNTGSNSPRSDVGWTLYDILRETGGDQAHNNMPPYLVVYMWKRVG